MTDRPASILITDGDLKIRPLRDLGNDYLLLAGWLSDHRVLAWYQGRDRPLDLPSARDELGPIARGETEVSGCIVERISMPIGYLQYYPVLDPTDYALESAERAVGMDLFLGEPDLWGKGLGTRVIRLAMGMIFESAEVERLVIDPHADNPRALRAYEKAGFQKIKVLPAHELHEGEYRDCWLMEACREAK
jgi:aminoglycoside 6'-N-acetyltransferase